MAGPGQGRVPGVGTLEGLQDSDPPLPPCFKVLDGGAEASRTGPDDQNVAEGGEAYMGHGCRITVKYKGISVFLSRYCLRGGTTADEHQVQKKPVSQKRLDKEELEALYAAFEERNDVGDPLTIDELAEKLNMNRATVSRHRNLYNRRRQEQEVIRSTSVRPDPLTVLEYQLKNQGLGADRVNWAVETVRATPTLLRDPFQFTRLLKEGCGLRQFPMELVYQAVMSAVAEESGQPTPPFPMMGPQPIGGVAPGQALAWPFPGQTPYGATPYGWPNASPIGYPPPYYPAYPQSQAQKPLTEEEIEEKIHKVEQRRKLENLDKIIEEAVRKAIPQAPTDGQFEETQEPIIAPGTGQPMVGPDGQVLMRFTRRPISAGGPQAPSPLALVRELRDAGILGGSDPRIEMLSKNLEKLIDMQLQGSRGADPDLKATLEEMRKQASDTRAQLAEEKARREMTEKYAGRIEEKDRAIRLQEIELATTKATSAANAGLPPDAQILNKAIDVVDQRAKQLQANLEKRFERVENVVTRAVLPPPPAVPQPIQEQDLARLERHIAQGPQPVPAQESGVVDGVAQTIKSAEGNPAPEARI